MGFVRQFPGYRFDQEDPLPSAGKGSVADVYGTVYWTVDVDAVNQSGLDGVVSQWNGRGYKVALLLPEGQQIEGFEYGGINLQRVEAAADLHSVLGTPGGHQWSVWGLPRGHRQHDAFATNVVAFKVRVQLAGPAPTTQFIPVLSRHREGSFGQSMPGLWVIRRASS